MAKMKLVVMEQDSYFIDMLSSYIRSSEYAETFTVSVFTTKEQACSFIGNAQEAYLLLVHESFIPLPERAFQRQGCLVILSDSAASADVVEYPVLCKYQPLSQLLSHLVSHYNEYASSRILKGERNSRVISVFSAVGGSGKTLTAVHLGRELAYMGKKVFYLNLEQLPAGGWLKENSGEEDNYFSRMLYYGKSSSKLQAAKAEQLKRKHRIWGFDYFPGASEPAEMSEMTGQDAESLIEALLASGGYDIILLDLDSSLDSRVTASLKLSDLVLWLVTDDCIALEKCRLLLRQLTGLSGPGSGLQRKLRMVVNKYSGAMNNGAAALPLPISGYLPYMPEWKSVGSAEALQVRGAFSDRLSSLSWIHAKNEVGGDAYVVG